MFQRAIGLHQQGQIVQAQSLYSEIIAHDPKHFDALHLLGLIYLQQRDFDRAVRQMTAALEINSQFPPAYNNRGIAFTELKNYDSAISDFNRALALKPSDPEAHYNKGRAHLGAGRLADALQSLDQAIKLRPDYAEAHLTRGVALAQEGAYEAALASHDRAVALQPQWPDAHFNRGNVLTELGRTEDAIDAFSKAIQFSPFHADALNNRGNLQRTLARYEQALADFTRAAQARPGFAGAEVNRAMALLTIGNFAEGWAAYEWRFQTPELMPVAQRFTQPRWTGAEDINGKTVLLVAEQGLGDTLQFCRFAKNVADKGANVVLAVQRPLKRLLTRLPGISAVYADDETLPPYDYYSPLLSLPSALRVDGPAATSAPYLFAEPQNVSGWLSRLNATTDLRVGLVWAGSPRKNLPAAHAIDKKRSLHLAQFAPLASVAGVQFISLQKGEPASQLAELNAKGWSGPAILDLTPHLDDFADTAALVANLDLVITCDTSVAHLAGGMGKPVWILNRFDGCWRWLHGRTDTPWYPTAKLFQQPEPGDWDSVITAVVKALARYRSSQQH